MTTRKEPTDSGSSVEAGVDFDVLFKTATPGRQATVETVDRFRPDPEAVAVCQGWLEKQGVVVQPTGFSLACRATRARFESLFGVTLVALDATPGRPWRIEGRVRIPEPLAQWVEAITVPSPPEFFGAAPSSR